MKLVWNRIGCFCSFVGRVAYEYEGRDIRITPATAWAVARIRYPGRLR